MFNVQEVSEVVISAFFSLLLLNANALICCDHASSLSVSPQLKLSAAPFQMLFALHTRLYLG